MSGRQHGEAYRRLRSAERPSVCAGLSRCGMKCKAAEVAIITALLMSMTSASDRTARRLPAFWRWFGIAPSRRALAPWCCSATTFLGAAPRMPGSAVGVCCCQRHRAAGAEAWKTPGHLRQFAGAGTVAKLASLLWMLFESGAGRRRRSGWSCCGRWSSPTRPASFRHRRIGALWEARPAALEVSADGAARVLRYRDAVPVHAQLSKRMSCPDVGLGRPSSSREASPACRVPMTPVSGANTPMTAHASSPASLSAGTRHS